MTVPPVKDNSGTFGCFVKGDPAFGPVPNTILTTPFGNPASTMTSHNLKAVTEVNSLGLQTAVQPYAMQGAIFHVKRYSGRFQGEISAATPTGSQTVYEKATF